MKFASPPITRLCDRQVTRSSSINPEVPLMNTATVTPAPRAQETRGEKSSAAVRVLLILGYLIIWAGTRAHFMADTNVYTQAILAHQHGGGSLDYRLLTSNPFWDFGHVLWRPVGWLCFVISKPVMRMFAPGSERAEVILTLITINFVAALVCVFLFFLLARRIIWADWAAAFATLGLFSTDAFLDYSHSGNAYVVGLSCLVAGMYLSFGEGPPKRFASSAILPALMFALAVLFWFPYIFVLPAAMAAPLLIHADEHWRRSVALRTVLLCAVIGLGVYASTIAVLGIRNGTDLRDWILAAGHGHIQAGGLRVVARLAFSVPRSFINMNRDGMWLKRYLIHDPYAPVTSIDLFRLSLWKLVLFYVSAAIVGVELLRLQRGRVLALLLASTVVPIFVFAVFIFEAGSIERYLPLYPFVFLACGYVLASEHATRASKVLLALGLAVMAAINANAMRTGTLKLEEAGAISRIHDLLPSLGPNSLVMAVNEQDNLAQFRQNFPLDGINLNGQWRNYDMLEISTERLGTWREDFAKQVLATWRRHGDVWLPERVFRSKPNPDWNWVEGDDKRVKWTDLPSFFSQFDTGPLVGGEDGFGLLQDNAKDEQILTAISHE